MHFTSIKKTVIIVAYYNYIGLLIIILAIGQIIFSFVHSTASYKYRARFIGDVHYNIIVYTLFLHMLCACCKLCMCRTTG